ncbi:hypothetical protein GWK47_004669 [Chionoecetes opilio]|uniref:Uncharacterized protein n=1 Tax=Chionoecetes opilio TaxID=41210 RepID=A0A8J4YDQ3_CHIOP|nr:hypothetical protein GWK47_004669 [Chionoecetes opilio]
MSRKNASVKETAGAVGLTGNPAVFVANGIARDGSFFSEFEGSTEKRQDTDGLTMKKETCKMAFAQDVRSLSPALGKDGNPFADTAVISCPEQQSLWTQQWQTQCGSGELGLEHMRS